MRECRRVRAGKRRRAARYSGSVLSPWGTWTERPRWGCPRCRGRGNANRAVVDGPKGEGRRRCRGVFVRGYAYSEREQQQSSVWEKEKCLRENKRGTRDRGNLKGRGWKLCNTLYCAWGRTETKEWKEEQRFSDGTYSGGSFLAFR